jgi:hypothetical protein
MFTVKSTELGKAFDNAYHSLWVDANPASNITNKNFLE